MEAERSAFSKLATRVRGHRPLVLFRSKYFKCFSNGSYLQNRMAFRDLRAARPHFACPNSWPSTFTIRPLRLKTGTKKPFPMIQVGYLDEM
jgi:hypothetical protein